MKKIEIFEPAMCCPTGLCGPGIDPELLRISTLVNNLNTQGININRYNLTNTPQNFITNEAISKLLTQDGAAILPVTLVDGAVMKTKLYPTQEELATWLGIVIEIKNNPIKNNDCGSCGGNECC